MRKRLGNFEISEEIDADHNWLRIKAVSGFWETRFRDDNEMYDKVRRILAEPVLEQHLTACIQLSYIVCNTVPDLQFLEDMTNAYVRMSERYQAKPLTDEEDKKILDEMKETYRQAKLN